jgi:hypothetical protein
VYSWDRSTGASGDREGNYGLQRVDGTTKPAWTALTSMIDVKRRFVAAARQTLHLSLRSRRGAGALVVQGRLQPRVAPRQVVTLFRIKGHQWTWLGRAQTGTNGGFRWAKRLHGTHGVLRIVAATRVSRQPVSSRILLVRLPR